MIKVQYNTQSGNRKYNGKFIPITHEDLLIFLKNSIWNVDIKFVVTKTFNIKNFENVTWRDLIQAALESLGGQGSLQDIYELIADCKKAKQNQYWKEKTRQTLQIHHNFASVKRGVWKLKIA